ncbi:hypothetical protein ACLQ2M_32535 [Streptomyces sp. DT7]|uniref:hypothetical protein n=1 Tax=unclassified Streptomyces TaxID=2593676 RepID=UPI002E2A4556|nr:hypothetical protein [Streptomyces sp. NBC_00304]
MTDVPAATGPGGRGSGAAVICVDCDQVITGAYVVVAYGDSMSAARQNSYAHPPRTPECLPRTRKRLAFRRKLDDSHDLGRRRRRH